VVFKRGARGRKSVSVYPELPQKETAEA
jgi:hypothetical protein